jgi:hypothetical protein
MKVWLTKDEGSNMVVMHQSKPVMLTSVSGNRFWASDRERMFYKEKELPEISFVDSPVEIDLKLGKR